MADLSQYRKGVTAVVGAVLIILSAFFPGRYDSIVQSALAVLTALGVYAIPNEPV